MASPARARSLIDWTWAPSGSIAGSGVGVDPRWVWGEEADPLVASLLDRGAVPEVNRLLRDWNRNDQPLPRNTGPTPEGVELTDILLGQLAEQTSPGSISRPLCDALARYLVGDQVADWDGIEREPVWGPLIGSAWPKLVKFREGLIPLPLVPQVAWVIDEAARRYILFYLTKGKETKIEIPTTNRPG
ncbi:hypothetical protein Aros01_02996 [Streptosporangium roseum]|uniref:Uncharacterized protein n=2 Tax=Streptosporangium roseum TaxID=2001 RepID=D2BAA8_STRRD|nr:hypothetical protein Sros_5155 [Streptosporangium roseum DSM 43021]